MFTAKVTQNNSRDILAKFREIVTAHPDVFTTVHDRTRATKTRQEDNTYSLVHADGTTLVSVHTNKGRVRWTRSLAGIMRGAKS